MIGEIKFYGLQNGVIKSYSSKTGYGFIIGDQEDKDIFLHVSRIMGDYTDDDLQPGRPVSFRVMETRKGLEAITVTLA